MKHVVVHRPFMVALLDIAIYFGLDKKIAWYVKPELKAIRKKLKEAPKGAKVKDVLTFDEFRLLWQYS